MAKQSQSKADPPENCHLNVKNSQKKLAIFFKKIAKNVYFSPKNCHWQLVWKKMIILGNFLTLKWQFSGGTGPK